jgi:hypothetical protein
VPRDFAERLLASLDPVGRERRAVTILFSDVKGSTALAENLDPKDVMEIMDGALDVLIKPVYRYEDMLARLMGDAILAFFSAPIAHEDDPERAIRAALDILAGAREYVARKLITPLFETEALGPIEVKGKAEPVPVYRVLAARQVTTKLRGIAGLQSPLIGREPELRAFQHAVERLQVGVSGIVTVVGKAGIGKSRLVAELRDRLGVAHFPDPSYLKWVEGLCLSYDTLIAYLL